MASWTPPAGERGVRRQWLQGGNMGFFSRLFGGHAANPTVGTKPQLSEASSVTSSTMDEQTMKTAIDGVLTHEAPVVFGTVSDDLQQPLSELEKAGDPAVPHIRSAILARA